MAVRTRSDVAKEVAPPKMIIGDSASLMGSYYDLSEHV
jgi:hypothetical protein